MLSPLLIPSLALLISNSVRPPETLNDCVPDFLRVYCLDLSDVASKSNVRVTFIRCLKKHPETTITPSSMPPVVTTASQDENIGVTMGNETKPLLYIFLNSNHHIFISFYKM